MKIRVGENSFELIPESKFEREQLKKLAGRTIHANIADQYFESRNWPAHVRDDFVLELQFPPDDWGT
jgi:hypothetical protein